jgi:hypothetical protein
VIFVEEEVVCNNGHTMVAMAREPPPLVVC